MYDMCIPQITNIHSQQNYGNSLTGTKLYLFISLQRIDYGTRNTIKSKSDRGFEKNWAEKGMNVIQKINYHNR